MSGKGFRKVGKSGKDTGTEPGVPTEGWQTHDRTETK